MKKIIFALLIIPVLSFSQHNINGTFSPAKDYTYAFLYEATPDGANYVERAKLDSLVIFYWPWMLLQNLVFIK